MIKKNLIILFLILTTTITDARVFCHVKCFGPEDGLRQSRITSCLQDNHGFIWMSSWGGLIRYDGYDFYNFRPLTYSRSHQLSSNRLYSINIDKKDNIWCLSSDNNIYFFNRKTCIFTDVMPQRLKAKGRKIRSFIETDGSHILVKFQDGSAIDFLTLCETPVYKMISKREGGYKRWINFADRQPVGNHVSLPFIGGSIEVKGGETPTYLFNKEVSPVSLRGNMIPQGPFNYTFKDNMGRLWLFPNYEPMVITPYKSIFSEIDNNSPVRSISIDCNRHLLFGDKAGKLCISDINGGNRRWITRNGNISAVAAQFSSKGIYCIYEDKNHRIWIGTRGDGLYVLKSQGNGSYAVRRYSHGEGTYKNLSISDDNIYCVHEDKFGHIWVGTYGGGLNLIVFNGKGDASFYNLHNGKLKYPLRDFSKVRCIEEASDGTLLIGTTEGLVTMNVVRCQGKVFVNSRNTNTPWSLKGSDIMQITKTGNHFYLCVYGVGIAEINSDDLLSSNIHFKTYYAPVDLTADQMLAGIMHSQNIWMASSGEIIAFSTRNHNYSVFRDNLLDEETQFAEARPLAIGDRLYMATINGLISFDSRKMQKTHGFSDIVISGVQYQGENSYIPLNDVDTLRLSPERRNFMLFVSSITAGFDRFINYSYKLLGYDETSSYIGGGNHSISYKNLPPGTYTLEIRATTGNGQWQQKVRRITIIIEPQLTETALFHFICFVFVMFVIFCSIRLWLYIKNLQQMKFALDSAHGEIIRLHQSINNIFESRKQEEDSHREDADTDDDTDNDAFLKMTTDFLDQNISDTNLTVADLAHHFSMSYTTYYNKVRQASNMSPVEFIKKFRIRCSLKLLENTDMNISEIAYAVGFNDPKYFTKCFRNEMNMTPTAYKHVSKSL